MQMQDCYGCRRASDNDTHSTESPEDESTTTSTTESTTLPPCPDDSKECSETVENCIFLKKIIRLQTREFDLQQNRVFLSQMRSRNIATPSAARLCARTNLVDFGWAIRSSVFNFISRHNFYSSRLKNYRLYYFQDPGFPSIDISNFDASSFLAESITKYQELAEDINTCYSECMQREVMLL